MTLPIRKAVGSIIISDSRPNEIVLVNKIKREDVSNETISEWDLPKGGIKENETPLIALQRELYEELGTKEFEIIKELPIKLNFRFSKEQNKKYAGQETILYLIKCLGNKEFTPKTSEIKEAKFFKIEEAINKIPFIETKNIINKIKNKLIG